MDALAYELRPLLEIDSIQDTLTTITSAKGKCKSETKDNYQIKERESLRRGPGLLSPGGGGGGNEKLSHGWWWDGGGWMMSTSLPLMPSSLEFSV